MHILDVINGGSFERKLFFYSSSKEMRLELENKIKKKIGKAVAPLTVSVMNFGNFT